MNQGHEKLQLQYLASQLLSSDAQAQVARCRQELEDSAISFNGPILMAHSIEGNQLWVYESDYAHCCYLREGGDIGISLGSVWCGTIIYNQQGKLLLAKRAAHLHIAPDQWSLPSGGIMEPGETPYEAMLRECSEELGPRALSSVSEFNYLGYSVSEEPQGVGMIWHGMLEDTSHLAPDPNEISELAWYSPNELPEDLKPDIYPILRMWLSSKTQRNS